MLTLRRTSEGGRATALRSGIRPQVRLGDQFFDAQLDLLANDELHPGETAPIAVSFFRPVQVAARIRAGDALPVFEGAREIGTVEVTLDVWKEPDRVVEPGKEYSATVTRVGWTAAEVRLENGWTAALHSRDVGLAPWAEIGASLHEGDHLRVRVDSLDATTRTVALSVPQERSSGD
jgi:hypothetical protein